MYLLDTDICIYIIKRKPPAVLERLQQLDHDELFMSSITYAELTNGAKKSARVASNLEKLDLLADYIDILPFDRKAAWIYGDVRSELESKGQVIGSNDLLIAAHALSLKLILVTNNCREFSRVNGLKFENWVSNDH